MIKNDRLASVAGEIPMGMCWPELWVVDAMHEKWAKELIAESKILRNPYRDSYLWIKGELMDM